jgi:hypothetical protein
MLNAAKPSLLLDIDVQFHGVETMSSRQYRHTWISRIIDHASVSCSWGTYPTI